jgi:hypothetical protein
MAAHYAVVTAVPDPGRSGAAVLLGSEAGLAERILDATPLSATYASESFAAALAATGGTMPEAQFVGDLAEGLHGAAIPLFALATQP